MKNAKAAIFFTILLCAVIIVTACAIMHAPTQNMSVKADYKLIGVDNRLMPTKPRDDLSGNYGDFLIAYKAALNGDFEEAVKHMEVLVAKEQDSVYLLNEMGALYLQTGDYASAITTLRTALSVEPNNAETMYLLGASYHGMGLMDLAMQTYETAMQLPDGKKNPDLYYILAKLFMDAGELANARKLILQGAKAFPNVFGFQFILAEIYFEAKEYAKAEEAYKKTLRIEPNFFEARFALAHLYITQKRYNDAINVYGDILEFDPENSPAMLALALLYRDTKRPADSVDMLETLAVLAKSDALVTADIYGIYIDTGKYNDALYLINGILNVTPNNDDLRYLAAVTEQSAGNFETALGQYALIPENSRYYPNAIMQTAVLLNYQGRPQDAIKYIQHALNLVKEPNDELYFLAGLMTADQNQLKLALSYFEKALAINPDNIQFLLQTGMVLQKLNRVDDALKIMNKVLELDPNNGSALNFVGYVYAERGTKLDEAEVYIKRALSQAPDDGFIIDSLGWVYYQKGDYEQALEYLLRAYAIEPDDPVILEHLGDTYLKLDKIEAAVKFYKNALLLDVNKERTQDVTNKLNKLK